MIMGVPLLTLPRGLREGRGTWLTVGRDREAAEEGQAGLAPGLWLLCLFLSPSP